MDNMVDFCGFLATWRSCILMVTIISVYLVLFEPNKFPFFYCISSFQFSNFDCFGSLKFLRDLAFWSPFFILKQEQQYHAFIIRNQVASDIS